MNINSLQGLDFTGLTKNSDKTVQNETKTVSINRLEWTIKEQGKTSEINEDADTVTLSGELIQAGHKIPE